MNHNEKTLYFIVGFLVIALLYVKKLEKIDKATRTITMESRTQ